MLRCTTSFPGPLRFEDPKIRDPEIDLLKGRAHLASKAVIRIGALLDGVLRYIKARLNAHQRGLVGRERLLHAPVRTHQNPTGCKENGDGSQDILYAPPISTNRQNRKRNVRRTIINHVFGSPAGLASFPLELGRLGEYP